MSLRLCVAVLMLWPMCGAAQVRMSRADYEDRAHAAWLGQMLATLMGFQFEHKAAAVAEVRTVPRRFDVAPVDDDYYYELVALRALEKHGIGMTVEQLGQQWIENNAGAWGSSEQARLLLKRGIRAPDTGHPRYNRLWFSIGPQFSGDIYGLLAPGMPNVAGRLAREYGRVNGYAEGVDGAVFVAGMVSLGFVEKDSRAIVRQAAQLVHPSSPYRQAIDQVIAMAEKGASAEAVANAIEDRWRIEYPASNNAVPNGAIVAISVWFGGGDFLKTINIAFAAADFTDADCNAANAAAVVGAMKGMKGIPPELAARLKDRIRGDSMGGVPVVPPVDESIWEIARRTVKVGMQFVAANGGRVSGETLVIPSAPVKTQDAELFALSDFMKYWNPEWRLERAGIGGAGGGIRGLRGITHVDGDVLATYPRDEARGLVISRTVKLGAAPVLTVEVAADPGRVWQLEVMADNNAVFSKLIEGAGGERKFEAVEIPLKGHENKETRLRLFQRVLIPERYAGNAYWRNLRVR